MTTPDNTSYRPVRMIHAQLYKESGGTSGLAEFPESAVPEHYRAGWALLTEDQEAAVRTEAGPEPRRVSLAEAQAGLSRQPAEQDPGGETAGGKAGTAGKSTGGRASGQKEG